MAKAAAKKKPAKKRKPTQQVAAGSRADMVGNYQHAGVIHNLVPDFPGDGMCQTCTLSVVVRRTQNGELPRIVSIKDDRPPKVIVIEI